MNLPESLKNQIHNELSRYSLSELKNAAKELSRHYKNHKDSYKLFKSPLFRSTYFAIRVPAIYGAICRALKELSCRKNTTQIKSVLDLGCGPGTGSWGAIYSLEGSIKEITLWDHSDTMIQAGKKLAEKEKGPFQSAIWKQQNLVGNYSIPKVDLVLISYVLNELNSEELNQFLENLLKQPLRYCLFIEPGDPNGFEVIRKVRAKCIEAGLHFLAPCPHRDSCPIQKPDWCHFSQRIPRERIQRLIKDGDLGYEDEKFSYVLVTSEETKPFQARILQHPAKHTGHVSLKLCHESGHIRHRIFSKKEKINYKFAKKALWGDLWHET